MATRSRRASQEDPTDPPIVPPAVTPSVSAATQVYANPLAEAEQRAKTAPIGSNAVPKPEPFHGNPKYVQNFLFALSLFFVAMAIEDDNRKLAIAGTLLHGAALTWYRGVYPTLLKYKEGYKEFERLLLLQFSPVDTETRARENLDKLSQTGSVSEYNKLFLELCLAIPGFQETKECTFRYMMGLKTKQRLECRLADSKAGGLPLAELMHIAAEVDAIAFPSSRPLGGKNGGYRPAGNSGSINKVSAEKHTNADGKMCYYCKKPGHLISACPDVTCRRCGEKGHTDKVCQTHNSKNER